MKRCSICAEVKAAGEFYPDPPKSDGLTSACKPCNLSRKRLWRAANRERVIEYERNYRAANKANEARRAREWKKTNPAAVASYIRKRLGVPGAGFAKADVVRLLALQKSRCAACGADISVRRHIDHIVPIALGGENSARNIQLLCPPCNMSKGMLRPEEFMRRLGKLL